MSSYEYNPIIILDTSNALGSGSGGSLTIGGGISVGMDTYIGGNIVVSGTQASFADNILVLNKSPSGSFDTGILLERFSSDINNNNNKIYAGIIYQESSDEFSFGYTNSDTRGTISLTSLIPIRVGGLTVTGGSLTSVNSILTSLSSENIICSSSFTSSNISSNSITTGTLFTSTGITTGSMQLNGNTIQFSTTGGTQVNINIDDSQALRFGTDSQTKTHVLVVGERFTTGGRIAARYSRYSSWEYTNGTTASIRMIIHTSGNVGIGTSSPSYQLHLSSDSAAKPSSNTWTISSDSRLKSNITIANLDACYNTIKNLQLKRYTWREDIFSSDQVTDRSKLGWIAQDVETFFPKAVNQIESFGYSDCRTLNSDQIYASLYGCVQKLITKVEQLESRLDSLEPQTNT